ncbi:DUF7344 domain-containing protein [Halosimplex amylolyticum]|uniref:DUF7344 domain-containing protein n=1 Tax=Halosimplex amylolyticum TaxID=3396616 RepID=UPI003F574C89
MPPADCYPEEANAVDEILGALAHHLRREIINYFENEAAGDTATIDEIGDYIDTRMPDGDRENLPTVLVHKHLPKLESVGWLEFDQRNGEVRYRGLESAPELLGDVQEMLSE